MVAKKLQLILAMDSHALSANNIPPDSVILGKSAAMSQLERRLARVLAANLPILLEGESGAGKNTFSKFIYKHSRVNGGRYVRVDCACWGELIGFESGAMEMTDVEEYSRPNHKGVGVGMLFLDEVNELSAKAQLHLLRLLRSTEDHDNKTTHQLAKARIVSASSRKLRHLVLERTFRRDLFHRIAVVPLEIPPLRDRADDLLPIASYLLARHAEVLGIPARPFPKKLIERMHYYAWPGNIRELENFICRYVILGPDKQVVSMLGGQGESLQNNELDPGDDPLHEITKRTVADVERRMMARALSLHDGNLRRAAETLGISYRTLINKMDQAGLPRPRHSPRTQ
jgi:DNA-binding NtrC family response regulator